MLERVLRFIEAQVTAGEVRVGTLARLAPLSLFHFIRSFKDSTGVSPHQFVLQRRIEHAKALLAEGRHASEVALDVGFASPSSFAAAFRRVTRTTPSAFRLTPHSVDACAPAGRDPSTRRTTPRVRGRTSDV